MLIKSCLQCLPQQKYSVNFTHYYSHLKVLVAQSCLILCDHLDCGPLGSSVHRIFQARILEWVAIPFSWRLRFDPWVGGIPWRREWQPTAVFLPEKAHGQRSLAGYSPGGCRVWTWLSDLHFIVICSASAFCQVP